jgi:hypothetical protein
VEIPSSNDDEPDLSLLFLDRVLLAVPHVNLGCDVRGAKAPRQQDVD